MTETQKRIKAYQNALPHMKERVMAVAMLLVISISMMTSATFAWITLSRSPEVTGLATTIATNGNLEIALSNKEGVEPQESHVGDGGQDVRLSNLTWGNLINLSDPSYGLEAVTLRPAQLNNSALDISPLYSVVYGADGRIQTTTSEFLFTSYETRDGVAAFYIPEDGDSAYGVRAVSSVMVTTEGEEALVDQLDKAVSRSFVETQAAYQRLYNNKVHMSAITQLASVYLDYRWYDEDQDCTNYIEGVYNMVDEFRKTMEAVRLHLLDVANLQHYLYCNKNAKPYTAFTETDLINGTVARTLADENITMDSLDDYAAMHTKFYGNNSNGAYYQIKAIYDEWLVQKDYVGWEELAGKYSEGGPINTMAHIPSTTVNGVPASGIGKDTLGDVAGKDPNVCVVNKGLVRDMDQLLGTQLVAKVDSMKAIFVTVENIQISTSAQEPWPMHEDDAAVHQAAAAGGLVARNATAADTYGMAIDFWVRTNSKNSKLILEGEIVEEEVVLTDFAGNPLTDEDGNVLKEKRTVAYRGVNRVWESGDPDLPESLGTGTSVTQGTGSCYVFYPNSTEDQNQSIELLKAMTVAFVDENGKLLVTANMMTDKVFKDGGRVLVPLQVQGRNVIVGQEPKLDENGDPVLDEDDNPIMVDKTENIRYITDLTQNDPQRITAILYLDGTKLTNKEVLAAGSIKGQLNLQFGTTEDLVSVNDAELKKEGYKIDVNVTQVSGDFEAYDPDNKPVVEVTLTLEGMDPKSVRANFVSMVSATQGAKQTPFTLERQGTGLVWKAQTTLNGAGIYQLRSIQIDGVDYALTPQQIEDNEVEIGGSAIGNVQCEGWNGKNTFAYKSADNHYELVMTADITGVRPRKVQCVFEHDAGQHVTVTFVPDGTVQWKGTGTFTTSGKYTMTNMLVDGVPVPLLGVDYKTLELQLGLRTRVFITQPVNAAIKNMQALQETLETMKAEAAARAATTLSAEQKTLAAELIAASELADADKTALTEAVNADSLTTDQIKSLIAVVEAAIEAAQDALNNGDPNDPDDGMQLSTSASGYEFFFDGGSGNELYMNVSATIADDKGNPLTEMTDVKLEYKSGDSILDETLQWNPTTKAYEGQFQLWTPGNYKFHQLWADGYQITIASSAPKIAANSRTPMVYRGPSVDYVETYTNIDSQAKRPLTVVLEHAPAATVKMTAEYTDTDADGSALQQTQELDAYLSYSDRTKDLYEYTVDVPTDGTWELVGMRVANVVYERGGQKQYYDGTDTGTGWVDLSAEVQSDAIITRFFTTVNYNVNTQPKVEGYTGGFMEEHPVENMAITLTDYLGRPIEDADISLKYTWDPLTAGFTVTEGVNYPNTSFASTKDADGMTFYMPEKMNFQMSGSYVVDLQISIGDETFTNFNKFSAVKGSQTLNTTAPISVQWNQLPNITISAISPDGTGFAVDETLNDSTTDPGSCDNRTTNPAHKAAGKHSYVAQISADKKTATVYIECESYTKAGDDHECKPAEVTLNLPAITGVTKASLSFYSVSNKEVYLFTGYQGSGLDPDTDGQTSSFDWTSRSDDCKLYVGRVSGTWNESDRKFQAGTLKSKTLTLTHNGIDYDINYQDKIVINNPY